MRVLGFLFVLFLGMSCSAQKLRTLHFGTHLTTDLEISSSYRLVCGFDWFKAKKYGFKKSIYFVHGRTSIADDYAAWNNTEPHQYEVALWGINTLFSVYHRSEKYKLEIGTGMGPGIYRNTQVVDGHYANPINVPSFEIMSYLSTGSLFKKFGLQVNCGLVYAENGLDGLDTLALASSSIFKHLALEIRGREKLFNSRTWAIAKIFDGSFEL